MKNEDKLLDAIGMIDEELIPEMPKAKESAAPVKHKKTGKSRKAFWIEIGIAAAAVILVVAIALPKVLYKKKNRAVKAEAVYPEMAKCPGRFPPCSAVTIMILMNIETYMKNGGHPARNSETSRKDTRTDLRNSLKRVPVLLPKKPEMKTSYILR